MNKKTETPSFEKMLDDLEKIVDRMDGDPPPGLEESLELFERGTKLSRRCREALARAEQRVETLTKDSGENASAHGEERAHDDEFDVEDNDDETRS